MKDINIPENNKNAVLLMNLGGELQSPFSYSGIKDEITSYLETAWIGTALNGQTPIYDIKGPQALDFLQELCVNDFSNLGDTGMRHAVICNEEGLLMTDGVAIKIGPDHYRTYWLNAPIDYYAQQSYLDFEGIDRTGQEFIIQIDGEKSLEILEDAFQADLHDIRFAKHRIEKMGEVEVDILRLSMTGNLGYELHGPMENFNEVYAKVVESGRKFGAKELGLETYNFFNHTEAGFPNINLHYPLPWFETDEEMSQYMYEHPNYSFFNISRGLKGSLGEDLESRFVTPYDVGLGFLVKFNHDFRGREALEKIAANPPRTAVTLEWNPEDVAKVFMTQITPGEEACDPIFKETDIDYAYGNSQQKYYYHNDWVLHNEEKVGVSSGRIISYNFNAMISLAWINTELAEEGNELKVLWGRPGTRQEEIRVKVARFPYNASAITINQEKDTADIPQKFK